MLWLWQSHKGEWYGPPSVPSVCDQTCRQNSSACFAAMLWQNHKGGWYGPPWCGRGGGAGGKGEVFRFVAGFCFFGAIAASRAILVVLFNIKPVAGWLYGCKLSYHGEIGWMVWPTNCYVEYYGMTATPVCCDNATKVDDKAHLYCEWMYHDHVTLCKGEALRHVFFFYLNPTWALHEYWAYLYTLSRLTRGIE